MSGYILYVEDDESVRSAITRCLTIAGYDVLACSSVEQSRVALKSILFDVAVSDWDLGRGDTGGQVYELVKTLQPDLVGRFMFLCGDQPETDVDLPWLRKPAPNHEVLRLVAELNSRPRTPRRQTKRVGSSK